MADLRLVGAVGIKVRPDTSGFRKATQDGLDKELGKEGDKLKTKTTIEVDADTSKAEAKMSRLGDEMGDKTVKLHVKMDYDGLKRAKEQVNEAMRSLNDKVVHFKMDPKSIADARRQLKDLEGKTRVKMEYDKDEAGYRSILNKIQRVRDEQAKLVDVPISFHTDEASLRKEERKAKEAIARIQAEKTVELRYSDNYDGIKDAIGDIDKRLEDIRKLKIVTKLDEASLEETRADLQEMMRFSDVTVKFNEDKEGYETVLSRIRKIQREKLEKEITFNVDDEALRQEARKFEKLIDEANERAEIAARFEPVTIEFNEDLEGYESVLKHLKKIQREKLVKKIAFNVDEDSLAAEIAKYEQIVEEVTPKRQIEIDYSNDRESLRRTLKQIDDELNRNWAVKIPVDADTATLARFRSDIEEQLKTAPIDITYNDDAKGYQAVLAKIKAIRDERLAKTIHFDTDEESLARVEAEMKHYYAKAEGDAKDLKEKIDSMQAAIKVGITGHLPVAAELKFLGRDRMVNYFARVNQKSIAAAEGMLKSLGGINALGDIGNVIEGLFTKFDTFSLKITAVATALGSLGAAGVYFGTAAFAVGDGMLESLGLLAAAPSILLAATAGYTIFTAAFNNFFDAFNKDPKIAKAALAELPPLARQTVDSITGLYKGLANPIQEKFWEHVGTTLSDAIKHLYPDLKKGLLGSTVAIGDFVAGFGRSMTKLSLNGDIDKIFGNLNGFFVNLSKASEPFFDGFNKFGLQGSYLLPRFGQWIADAATRFDEWATKASANGQIIEWIEQGVNSFRNMWEIGGSVGDMFQAISRAAGLAGTGGLAQFNLNMREAADRMMGEPWQSRAATIFEGARKGATGLNTGFQDLKTTLGNSAIWLGSVLTQLGDIGGITLTNLSVLFGNKTYQSGVTAELEGMKDLMKDLQPSFEDLGTIIGNMGVVAGSVFSALGPVVEGITSLLADVTTKLSDGLADVAPKMLGTIGGVFDAITPMVTGLADIIDGLLDVVGSVPNSFVLLGVAASAFFALRGLASKFYENLSGTKTFKNLEGQWLSQQAAAGKTVTKYQMVNGEMKKFEVPTGKFSVAQQAFSNLGGSVTGYTDKLRESNRLARTDLGQSALRANLGTTGGVIRDGLGKALGGVMGLFGGPWGLAFAGAGLVIGAFAQQQADAKQHVDDLSKAIDEQTGLFNKAGMVDIQGAWTDIDEVGDAWANFSRGAKAGNETAAQLKMNIGETTKIISQGGGKSDQLIRDLDNLSGALKEMETAKVDGSAVGAGLDILKGKLGEAGNAFGLTADEIENMGLKSADVEHLEQNIRKEATAAELARVKFEGLGTATGESSISAQKMAAAMQTIGDNSISAAGKIGAIKVALDLLKGGKLSAREAEVNAAQASQSAVDQAAAIRDELAKNNHLINETNGLIDVTSTSGLKLNQAMQTSADGILISAQAAYDAAIQAKKTPEEAMAAAQKVVATGEQELKKIAKAAGVNVEDIRATWEGFFGKEWELNATFSASADKFQAVREAVEESGLKWDQSIFKAFLEANPDPAKWTVEQATEFGKKYANDKYEAQLKAINPQALQKILEATGQAGAYKRGDYTGVMKALNSTGPGVQAAWTALMNVKGGPGGAGWAAAFKAYMDAVSAANTDADLNAIANRKRTAYIAVAYLDAPSAPGYSGNGRPGTAGGAVKAGLNGFLSDGRGGYPGGFLPQYRTVQAFANGGITVENPNAAAIYKPASQYRIFAEPATGGEAFIPLAATKRNRSTQILREVASQFGFKLTKAQAFENGGIVSGGNSRNAGLQVHIETFNQNANDTVEDIGRGIMRQARNSGTPTLLEGF